ncbi:MAG: hypothetical protein Q7T54_00015 [Candidatus Levybacteria bacterium]|nr:hypothetical protein [Candidatus Levybacteria bacterium]
MFERENLTQQEEKELEKRFDVAREYWGVAVRDGRAQKTEFYTQLFQSVETEIYRERGDSELLLHAAKTLNQTWVGVNREGVRDTHHLPTSSAASTTTST